MIVYDGQPILMDTMFFFVIGRLYEQRGIDHLAWLGAMLASGLIQQHIAARQDRIAGFLESRPDNGNAVDHAADSCSRCPSKV